MMRKGALQASPPRAPLQLTGQAVVIGLGRLVNMAAAAGTLMVLARLVPEKATYGALCQLMMVSMAGSQLFALGLPQATYYFLPRYQGGARGGFLTQTILMLMVAGGVMGAGCAWGADWLGRVLGSPELPPLLRAFALYPLWILPTLAVEGTLMQAGRPVDAVLFSAFIRLGMFCGLVIPTWHGIPLAGAVAIWTQVAAGMWALAAGLMASTARGQRPTWSPAMLAETWRFAVPLAATAALSVAGSYLDRILVSALFGAEAFGIYANAAVEIPTVTMVTHAVSVVLLAEFCRRVSAGEAEAVVAIWHRALLKAGMVVMLSFGFLAWWPGETMRLIFSERYAESGVLFAILVWGVPVTLVAGQTLLIALGETRAMVGITLVGLAIDVALLPVLGHFFGVRGVAAGVVLSRYLLTAIGLHWVMRRLPLLTWRNCLPWRRLGVLGGLALLAGGMSRLAVTLGNGATFYVFALGLALYALCYGVGLRVTGLLSLVWPVRSPDCGVRTAECQRS
jgi:O-antigen/teichoic acid export membrane protein